MTKTLDIRPGNLLDVTEGLIAHQVNLQGVMGAGLAKQIRDRYPIVYKQYRTAVQLKQLKLGSVQIVSPIADNNFWVANIAAQVDYGREPGKCYTNYEAIAKALSWLRDWQVFASQPVYLPYLMGAGLAGGDWSVIERLIQEKLPTAIILKL